MQSAGMLILGKRPELIGYGTQEFHPDFIDAMMQKSLTVIIQRELFHESCR
jgi:hypothetical protein